MCKAKKINYRRRFKIFVEEPFRARMGKSASALVVLRRLGINDGLKEPKITLSL